MEDILRRNQKNQIKANVRKTQKRRAYVQSRTYTGPKKSMVRSFINFVRGIARFVRSLFKQRIPERCSRTYKYEGPARVRGAEGKRFDVVMRQRGRKYKAANRKAS